MKRLLLFMLLILSTPSNTKSAAAPSASASEGDVKMTDVASAGPSRGTKRKSPEAESEGADVKMANAEEGDENPYTQRKKPKKTGWQAVLPASDAEGDVKMAEAKPVSLFPIELEREIGDILQAGDFAKLEKTINSNPAVVNMVDQDGSNLLMLVLLISHAVPDAIIANLISLTKDVNYRNKFEQSALMFAAQNGMANAVQQLLKHAASIDTRDQHGENPLMYAMQQQNPQVVMTLVKQGANVQEADNNDQTVLHKAIHWAVPPEQKISEKCDICKKVHSPSPEHQAKTVALLLQKGADINFTNADGDTPLLQAIEYGNIPVVRVLISKGADLAMAQGSEDPDPIRRAVVQRGLKRLDTTSAKKLTPHEDALFYETYLQIIKILLAANANPQTALLSAVDYSDYEVVNMLLINGAIPEELHIKAAATVAKELGTPNALPKTPAITEQVFAISAMLNYPTWGKKFHAIVEIRQKEQEAVAKAAIEHKILLEQPEIANSILEFINEPNIEPGQTTEQVRSINNIKFWLAKNDINHLSQILLDPERLELVDNDGNTPLLLALHYQKNEHAIPYKKDGTNALSIIITALKAADKNEEGKNKRLKRALMHKNKQDFDALELARALELQKEVIEYLQSERKTAGILASEPKPSAIPGGQHK